MELKFFIVVVTLGFFFVPAYIAYAEERGYYDPQSFNETLDRYHTCWPKDADDTTRNAVSVSVYISDCYEHTSGHPDDEVNVVIIRRTDQKDDSFEYELGPGENTPTISGNGYPLEVHIQWLNGAPNYTPTQVVGYINWYMN